MFSWAEFVAEKPVKPRGRKRKPQPASLRCSRGCWNGSGRRRRLAWDGRPPHYRGVLHARACVRTSSSFTPGGICEVFLTFSCKDLYVFHTRQCKRTAFFSIGFAGKPVL